MNKHPVDLGSGAAYIAGGGLASVAAVLAIVYPGHAALISAIATAVVAIAGLVRVMFNPTPQPGMSAVTAPTDAQPPLKAKDLSTVDAAPKGTP